jgi:non-specific serine/threonine protein kinase
MPARFVPLGEIGRGGMGSVWEAFDRLRGHTVAVKFPSGNSAEELERFGREARLITELRHPNIVRGYDFDTTPGAAYLTMEPLKGATVAELLDTQGPFSPERTADIGAQLASALQTVHDAGWVHRDIDTGNVVIEPGGRAKLLDFGVATPTDTREPDLAMREYTPGYSAPERVPSELGGMAHGGPATDLYSLGVVMHEMATGRPVFPGRAKRRLARQRTELPPRLDQVVPGTPRELSDVVARLLEPEYARRPQSAAEVLERLSAVVDRPAPDVVPNPPALGSEPRDPQERPGRDADSAAVAAEPLEFPGIIGLAPAAETLKRQRPQRDAAIPPPQASTGRTRGPAQTPEPPHPTPDPSHDLER